MKFKAISCPSPSKGLEITDKSQVVPDQSLSLREIIDRFTRKEPLPIGHEVQYHDSPDDLEKVAHMDLVDKEDFLKKQKETQAKYSAQEKARKAKEELDARKKVEEEQRKKLEKDGDSPAKADNRP